MHARPTFGHPSRPSTPVPTLLPLDHAPLRLPPSPPLHAPAPADPREDVDGDHVARATSAWLPPLLAAAGAGGSASASSSAPSSPGRSTSQLRSRRPLSPFPSSSSSSFAPAYPNPNPPGSAADDLTVADPHRNLLVRVDSDVTRPSLRRLNNDALGVAALGNPSGGAFYSSERDSFTLSRDSKGKGRAIESLQGSPRDASVNGFAGKEREVIVHKVQKTDSYASISLQYGITPQALRASNRLWPSDPIYLRSTLLIPLDQCNLPSSSFGVERIAREENGDLTVWERHSGAGEGVHPAETGRAPAPPDRYGELVSPQARRVATTAPLISTSPSASTMDLARPLSPTRHANGPPTDLLADEGGNEFHSVWSDGGTPSGRPSLEDSTRTTSTTSYFGDGRTGPGAPRPFPRSSAAGSTGSPSTATASSAFSPPPSNSSSSRASSPVALLPSHFASTPSSVAGHHVDGNHGVNGVSSSEGGAGANSGSASPPLAKRTLRVTRLPASQLAFFPPSSAPASGPSHPSGSAPYPDPSTTARQRWTGSTLPAGTAGQDESLFFQPLANSLTASLSSLGLDRYLPAAFSSSGSPASSSSSSSLSLGQLSRDRSGTRGAPLGRRGRIALPPSPALSSATTTEDPLRTAATTPVPTSSKKSRWALLDFRIEEDEAGWSARRGRDGKTSAAWTSTASSYS